MNLLLNKLGTFYSFIFVIYILKRGSDSKIFSNLAAAKLISIIGINVEVYPIAGKIIGMLKNVLCTAISNGASYHTWNNREGQTIGCCGDGVRPVVFEITRIDR